MNLRPWAVLAVVCLLPLTAIAEVKFLSSGKLLPGELPFSEAVQVGDTLYISGQVGIKPGTMQLVDGGMSAQSRQVLENIQLVLEEHGYVLSDLVKCTVMLEDIGDWPAFNEIYQAFLSKPYPARSAFGADGLALGALVEVECIAARAS